MEIKDLPSIRHWRTLPKVVIKESLFFTNIIEKLIPDDSYAEFQETIARQPDAGNIIPGGGGLRKVRWKLPGIGKRGGIRVIYYWISKSQEVYMLYAYAKAQSEDISVEQLKQLRTVVEEELESG